VKVIKHKRYTSPIEASDSDDGTLSSLDEKDSIRDTDTEDAVRVKISKVNRWTRRIARERSLAKKAASQPQSHTKKLPAPIQPEESAPATNAITITLPNPMPQWKDSEKSSETKSRRISASSSSSESDSDSSSSSSESSRSSSSSSSSGPSSPDRPSQKRKEMLPKASVPKPREKTPMSDEDLLSLDPDEEDMLLTAGLSDASSGHLRALTNEEIDKLFESPEKNHPK
jgi:hypothetical protein